MFAYRCVALPLLSVSVQKAYCRVSKLGISGQGPVTRKPTQGVPMLRPSEDAFTYQGPVQGSEDQNNSSMLPPDKWYYQNRSDGWCCLWQNMSDLPKEMQFTDDTLVSVVAYTCLFLVAAIGNLTVFITLFRNRNRKSRVNMFIMHLSIADLLVTFIMLPLETAWHITVAWKAGDAMCRILMFFRAFGFYLSSFILVVISLDRYFAILYPLSLNDADKRGKIMLALAWIFSGVASIPQSIIFHVETHPEFQWFTQCVTFNFFPSKKHELAYNLFNAITVYGLPLVIISISYISILWKISQKTKESRAELSAYTETVRSKLRRSGVGNIAKARSRTLKMTVVIVMVFVICWTPYFVISAWWWFDSRSFKKIDPKVQRGLLLFAVSNSCMDPIVYGMFSATFRRDIKRLRSWIKTIKETKNGHKRYQTTTV
ncbi:adipokinetic hormone/corazonin-related peptide receptor variant I-like [Liolophura sinensis]|uniref:adipokinetic hormone/corazonin-related peptide receptor variant I-like n=1 Tax=Liolophura sinensis TaxID=3198878 RepID=UPI0031586FBA